jgi:TetR/AcrR family transcriptional repressor of mexJK operon
MPQAQFPRSSLPDTQTGETSDPCADEGMGMDFPCGKSGRPRAADVEARTQNLIATASALFLSKGYSNVSLEMIAREAHVAVRTIYVKFGGKAGLLNAAITNARDQSFADMADIARDMRPVEQVLVDYARRFLSLVLRPAAISLHRMVIAEAMTNHELAVTFNEAGPVKTRETLGRYFSRPDVQAHFRDDLTPLALTVHFSNCIMGDQLGRFLFPPEGEPGEEELQEKVRQGVDLFFRGARR